ncbi:MAG: hypothetical protein LBD48_03695, partial [Treponema sp.]|nr:hypothetical protein [Treponema sp.]
MTKNSKAGSGCLKKTTVVVLLFILSAALCFAGGQKSDGGGKKIELEVVTWHPVLSDFYNKLFAEYNAAHPDVNVIITAKAGS